MLVLNIHWKDWCWSWSFNTLAAWCEELTHWKRLWCWERQKTGRGDSTGRDDWMASPTQWVWASSGRWWRTGKPGMLQSMGSQRVGHDWATELSVLKMDSLRFLLFREVFVSPAFWNDTFLDWQLCVTVLSSSTLLFCSTPLGSIV